MKEQTKNWILFGVTILILAVSLISYKHSGNIIIPSIGIAIGILLFGRITEKSYNNRRYKKYPKEKVQMEIELKDERNITINDKASAQTNRVMLQLVSVAMLALAFMKVDLIYVIIPAIFIVIQCIVYFFFYHRVEEKL